jgi:hypothetical protein
LVTSAVVSGVDTEEDVFFCLDSQILSFNGSSFWSCKRFAVEGLLLGDSESRLTKSTLWNYRSTFILMVSIVQVMKPSKPIGFPSPLAHEFSIGTFRHLKPIVMKKVPISKNAPFIHQLSRLLTVKFRQPSHEFTFGVDISFILYPLVLTPLV